MKLIIISLAGLLCWHTVSAQHTLGVTAGYGMSSGGFQPTQEMKGIWGQYNSGLSWRYYGPQRFVGGFGIDLEFVQQGFSFSPNASQIEEEKDYKYYTRKINSIMLPIVWQPHIYMARRHIRVYIEAAAMFSYNFSSSYENKLAESTGAESWKGDYKFQTPRDNRWGYGLAGGGGVAVLIKQIELNVRVRYYFGFSDVVKNRNKYTGTYSTEYPFYSTPLRSPLNNLYINIGVSYRFNKEGFTEWTAPRPRKEKVSKEFNYKDKSGGSNSSQQEKIQK